MMSSNSHIPWPRRGDRPFIPPRPGSRSTADQDTRRAGSSLDWEFRIGYYNAGVVLAKHLAAESGIDPLHGLVYPMLYCFRHYLELSLKSIAVLTSWTVGEAAPSGLDSEHGLMPLWNIVRPLILRAFGPPESDPTATLSAVECCLNDFHQVDSSSQTFRYHLTKSGKPVDEKLPDVDLPRILGTMQNLYGFFGACDAYADALLDGRAEMESHSGSDDDCRGDGWTGPC